jgi:hypothetical protein
MPAPPAATEQRRPSLAARVVLVLYGGLVACYLVLWLGMAARGSFWRADFVAFYTGWSMVQCGDSARLYDLDAQAAYQDRLVPERAGHEGVLPYLNPPHAALPLAPLARLSRPAAFYTWTLGQLGLLVLLGRQLLRIARDSSAGERAVLLATVLAFPPLFMTFQLGQVSLLSLVCLLGFYASLEEDRPLATAAWLVLGTVKPQLVLVPAVTLLATRRRRALWLAALLFGAWAVAASAVMGWTCWVGFWGMVRHCTEQFGAFGIDPLRMYNLKGLLTAVLGGERAPLINAASTAAFALALAVAFVLWRGNGRCNAPDFRLRVALTSLLGLLANPHFNPADALAFVLPAVTFASYLRRRGGASRAFDVLAVSCPALFLLDSFAVERWPGGVRPFFLVALGSAAWMACRLAADTPTARPVPAIPRRFAASRSSPSVPADRG